MRPTLLLADDSVTIQRVIELTFAHEDIRVIAVSDGRQAIQRIDLERPDIVLADVSMPQVDGYAVSAYVKQSASLRHVPVLLLTGAFEPVDEEKVRASGCDGVLVKPFGPQQLVGRVRELLAAHATARPWASDAPVVPRAADAGATTEPIHAVAVAAPEPEARLDVELEPLDAALASLASIETTAVSEPDEPVVPAFFAPAAAEPEPLEPPPEPVWDLTPGARLPAVVTPQSGLAAMIPVSKVSLATAFSALLAAEQARSSEALAPVVSEALVENAVRRVLERLTGEMVRTIVVDTAERLVKLEIERLKTESEPE